MPKERTRVSVVSPCYNESDSLPAFIERLQTVMAPLSDRFDFEIVLVDDGSSDDTVEIAKGFIEDEPRLRVVELRRNYGQSTALQAGFDHATGSIVISMDADLQHFPEDIPAFLDAIDEGSDVVCGWRHDRKEGVKRKFPSRVANGLIRLLTGLTIHDIGTTFRAYKKEILDDIQLLGEHHRFVPVYAAAAGAKISEIKIENVERPHGTSNYGLGRTVNVFFDLFFIFFYSRFLDRPIRIFGMVAAFFFGLATLISLGLILVWLLQGVPVVRDHSGWFIVAIAFYLTAIQVLMTGVLAEVIVRTYFQSGQKPSYRVRQLWSANT